ncbi:MAG: glycerol kinase GlpK [Bacteroides sp.]|nr:glycerol kinase GlpK [Bacteroides sp.]
MRYILTIDQSTSSTKAILFDDTCRLVCRENIPHKQYYPAPGWVEHDPQEIWQNMLEAIRLLVTRNGIDRADIVSLAITNQRETAVVWNKKSGRPVGNAVVWQCQRGTAICEELSRQGADPIVLEKSGLNINPYFSASGIKWLLDNESGARALAEQGELLCGTIESWLIWKLTGGRVHATDYTNASRTLLFNIHTLDWDDKLLELFTIPREMMPQVKPSDSIFAYTDIEEILEDPVPVAGVLGDSHGALVGQMCFEEGMGKATYGTGSSVMINIGKEAMLPPKGLVTSVAFAALGEVFYAFEGNIHCTGATIKWLVDNLKLINSPIVAEEMATSVEGNEGVYLVPAFSGLGAPWWNPEARAILCGMTLSTTREHVVRASLEAIAYQVKDLIDLMKYHTDVVLKELRVDGGPSRNNFLMQFQADMLDAKINRLEIEEASALGAVILSGFATGLWSSFEAVKRLRKGDDYILPDMEESLRTSLYEGWKTAVEMVNK